MPAEWPQTSPPSRQRLIEVFAQVPPTFPPDPPSLPVRPYQSGDAVAVNEVVLRDTYSGDMAVVYPGSEQAAARPWPRWVQVTSPL
jgi:hypothetical protein